MLGTRPSCLHTTDRLAAVDMGQKLGAVPPFWRGELGHHLIQCHLADAYLPTKWNLDLSSRLAAIDMGRKLGFVRLYFLGKLGPHLAQSRLGRGLPPYQVAS